MSAHTRRLRIVRMWCATLATEQRGPTTTEIMDAVGIGGRNTVTRDLRALEADGYFRRSQYGERRLARNAAGQAVRLVVESRP